MPTLTLEPARKGPFPYLVITLDSGERCVINENAHVHAAGLKRVIEQYTREASGHTDAVETLKANGSSLQERWQKINRLDEEPGE